MQQVEDMVYSIILESSRILNHRASKLSVGTHKRSLYITNIHKMKKYTIALIMILSFLVTSKLIYEEKFYTFKNGVVKIQLTEQQYYKSSNKSVRQIEKEYDYMMGGIISISLGLLLIGYNHLKNNNSKV